MMELPKGKTLLLFDGYCHLCNGIVKFIIKFDRKKKFLFSPLGSPTGTHWRLKHAIPDQIDSIIVIDGENYHSKADAALLIAKKLGGTFHVASIFYGLPRKYRDQLYDWLARNRYRWFGRYQSCMVPGPEHLDRFI